ncbi:MAG: response regulator [Bacteroidetes bacterium]|nr:response regulator [Bacteroidota bacterium]
MSAIDFQNSEKKFPKKQTKPNVLKALIASDVLYRRFFETSKEGILIMDAETGEIVEINPFLIDLLGFVKKRIIGKIIWEIGCFKNIVADQNGFFDLQKNGTIRNDDLLLITDKDQPIHVELISNTFLVNKKKVIQWNIRDITKRKQDETERLIYEARMHTLVQAIPDLIWLKDKDGVYLSCNIMFERYFGAKEAEIIGKTDYDFLDRGMADSFREHDIKAMNAGKPTSNVEWVTFSDDGHRAFLDTIKTPMFDANGFLIGVLGVGRDFTAFNLGREKELQANVRDITIKEQELIVVKKQLVFQNEEKENRAAELIIANKELAFQDEEKENRAAELIIADEELAFQNEEKENRAAELIIANKELAFQNKEKENRAAELIIADEELAFQNEEKENRAAELIIANKELVFQNEEKEKRAAELIIANTELAFQNEEKENRAAELIIANSELAFQNEEKENRAAELIIANKELVFQNEEKEKRAAELIIANTELAFQNEEKENRAAELIIANKELAFQNKEKEKRAAELIIANKELVFQNDEKEKRAAELSIANSELIFQNKEKEKRAAELIIAKENAEESDKLKTAFLQNMSHEIRTPLNGIIGFSSLLNDEDINKEEIKEFTTIIIQSGKRLIEIVNNVLDISKIQTGQIEIKRTPILINSIFLDLFTFFSPITNAKNIRLSFHNYNDESRTIYSDETKLNQILTNLINNAVKFTKSGNIDYGFEIKDDFIQFYVKDTGIGIEEELHDRIFDRFIQAEQTMTKNYEGAGLGLAISKGLVELLGGKIWVKSDINKGTTFFFTLPYKLVKVGSQRQMNHIDVPVKQAHGKVLVAEDDWTSFRYLNRILSKSDITVIHVENGAQAVEKVKTTPDIDLIMMDIRMPVMDGIEATKLIKQIRPDLPIIAQTAYAFEDEKNKILSIGCDEYLAKPLEYDKLNALLSKYLQ